MKKKIALLLSMALVACTVLGYGVPVMADGNQQEGVEQNPEDAGLGDDDNDDTVWQEDFDYEISGDKIILLEYIGEEERLYIPSTATIDGEEYDTTLPSDCSFFFKGNKNLEFVGFNDVDTSNVTSMFQMFCGCSNLKAVNLSCFDTSNVVYMSEMFADCTSLQSVDLSNFDTSKVTYMPGMFMGCSSLVLADLSSFNTSNVVFIGGVFSGCSSLRQLDLSGFDFSAIDPNLGENRLFFHKCDKLNTIKTPVNVAQDVDLPDVFFDEDNPETEYEQLPKGQDSSVTLVKKDYVPVTGVEVQPSDNEIEVGESFELEAVISPEEATDKDVLWVSDDTDVATVDEEGRVTGVGEGEATIAVYTLDGLYTDECVLIVNQPIIHVEGIQVAPSSKVINIGDEFSLEATVLPDNATDKTYEWSSDNPNVASVDDDGKVTGVNKGTATITATTTDGEKKSSCKVIVDEAAEIISYDDNTFAKENNGDVRCYDKNGNPVINEFKCDGLYTYYFQLDGTAMKDRLTYHPDGYHIIYFEENGHEVFSNFTHVRKSISGEDVDDYCFFDVWGHMYVDVLTYDQTGTKIYYANACGVMEVGKWFQFSNTLRWADGTPADFHKGRYGYAQADGSLMTDQYTYDWRGRLWYMYPNGVAQYCY